jgi:ATP-dependent exoDNAse (exonuclease V) beta subunit
MNYLAIKNPHVRDSRIAFDEPTHKYTIDGNSDYISVTTWIHSHFKNFEPDTIISKMMASRNWANSKYYGKTREEIKDGWEILRNDAAKAGTKLHFDIECFYNNVLIENTTKEYFQFKDFVKDYPFEPYRTEWTVFDEELKIAGSIDMTFISPDGSLMIYDWKRSKGIIKNTSFETYSITDCINHLPDTNYWHYALQLNMYKALLERNYGMKITKLCLVCLYPEQTTYNVIDLPDLENEICELFVLRKKKLEQT